MTHTGNARERTQRLFELDRSCLNYYHSDWLLELKGHFTPKTGAFARRSAPTITNELRCYFVRLFK